MTVQSGSEARDSLHADDTDSFDAFYRAHWTAVVGLTAARCHDVTVAEELAQEAFLRAHARWDRIGRIDRPDLWVRRVALNLATSRLRRLRAEARALLRTSARDGAELRHEMAPDVEEFWDALRALPARQGVAAALFYVDDLPVSLVAEVMGCAEGTVKAHLHAARTALHATLGHLAWPATEDDR